MGLVKGVTIVLAKWCPHCVPFSLSNAKMMAKDLCVPLRVLDIDVPSQLKAADKLVKEHGDWAEDYLIPQVFVEYTDGRFRHLLTGFSEGVSSTEAAWKAFFSSNYYRTLVDEQLAVDNKAFGKFVNKNLIFNGQCRRHCDKPTSFVDLQPNSSSVVGAYACPDGYVPRVVYFSVSPDINWFKKFLVNQVGKENVKESDIRTATRHGWELRENALAEICEISPTSMIGEVYWTVYPKSEIEKSQGVFLCSDFQRGKGCGRLFVEDIKFKEKLCPKCRESA
ncbi:MAG: hypothetical protein V1850_00870 [Candidatus Bathyarchaeota archaeon]